jgi:hypothetical protein
MLTVDYIGEPSFYSYRVHQVPNIPSGQSPFSVLKSIGLSHSSFLNEVPEFPVEKPQSQHASFDDVEPIRGELDYVDEKPVGNEQEQAELSYHEQPVATREDSGINWNLRGSDVGTEQLLEQQDLAEYADEAEKDAEVQKTKDDFTSKESDSNEEDDDIPVHPAAPAALTQAETGRKANILNNVNSMADVYFLGKTSCYGDVFVCCHGYIIGSSDY